MPTAYIPTIFESYTGNHEVEGVDVKMTLKDTAG